MQRSVIQCVTVYCLATALLGCGGTPSQVNDPDLGYIRFNGINAWSSEVDYDFQHGATHGFAIHVWAPVTGPTDVHRQRFRGLKAHYPELWPAIATRIVEHHSQLDTIDELTRVVSEFVTVHLGEHAEDSVELVYTLELRGEGNRAYRVPLQRWEVDEVIVAD